MSEEIGINKTEILDTVLHVTVTALQFRVWCQIQHQSIILLQKNVHQGLTRKNDLNMETGALQGISVSLALTENCKSYFGSLLLTGQGPHPALSTVPASY